MRWLISHSPAIIFAWITLALLTLAAWHWYIERRPRLNGPAAVRKFNQLRALGYPEPFCIQAAEAYQDYVTLSDPQCMLQYLRLLDQGGVDFLSYYEEVENALEARLQRLGAKEVPAMNGRAWEVPFDHIPEMLTTVQETVGAERTWGVRINDAKPISRVFFPQRALW